MIRCTLSLLIMLTAVLGVVGQESVDSVQAGSTKYTTCDPVETRISRTLYSVGMIANAGNSELAPYYISSNNGGNITQQYSALLNASLVHSTDPDKRFAWGAGIEVWGGYASSAGYQRYKGDGQFSATRAMASSRSKSSILLGYGFSKPVLRPSTAASLPWRAKHINPHLSSTAI